MLTVVLGRSEPNLKTVRELIYKRGHGKVNKQRIPLSDNAVIEEHLGKYGIVSIEDIVHEIITAGPHFKQVNNFLYPFHLSNPTGGFRKRKFKSFIEGGDTGKREHFINDLVRKMNCTLHPLPPWFPQADSAGALRRGLFICDVVVACCSFGWNANPRCVHSS